MISRSSLVSRYDSSKTKTVGTRLFALPSCWHASTSTVDHRRASLHWPAGIVKSPTMTISLSASPLLIEGAQTWTSFNEDLYSS